MRPTGNRHAYIALALGLFSASALAGDKAHDTSHAEHGASGPACEGFGPQTPRDIDSKAGTNPIVFPTAPAYTEMNLCNIHFHNNAEHKGKDFSIYAGEGEHGHGGGYQCNITTSLTPAELKPMEGKNYCKDMKPGDTLEVHWVHSSCDVKPGNGLGACVSESCTNPSLRVETQVLTVVNDKSAMNFNDLTYGGVVKGRHQAKAIPTKTGKPVIFGGSTTGPKYTEQQCSPYQVTWSVRPQCAKVDISSLSEWCKNNPFGEDHAHGVRKLVTNPKLLSNIK